MKRGTSPLLPVCVVCGSELPSGSLASRRYCDACRGSIRREQAHVVADSRLRLGHPCWLTCSCGCRVVADTPERLAAGFSEHRRLADREEAPA